jgi:hypothetical protein
MPSVTQQVRQAGAVLGAEERSMPLTLLMRETSLMTSSLARRSGRAMLAALAVLALALAAPCASPPSAVASQSVFDILDFTARALDSAGDDYVVAGGHPYEATSTFSFPSANDNPLEDVKSLFTELPPGFLGNPAATARCTMQQLLGEACPVDSWVGTALIVTQGEPNHLRNLYNIVPVRGYPAQFGLNVLGKAILLYPQLRPRTGQYGVTLASPGVAHFVITRIEITLFGTPSARNGTAGPKIPLLSNPADCLVAQPSTRIIGDSWPYPGQTVIDGPADFGSPVLSDPNWKRATAVAPAVTGCNAPALASQFAPSIDVRPTPGAGTTQADAPSGYTVELAFPQANDPTDSTSVFDPSLPAAPPLKDATVTLPEGVSISPPAADGLDGCSDLLGPGDQVHYETTLPVTCPEASKVGSVVATSPLLAERNAQTDEVTGAKPISGEVYILKPHPGDLSPAGDQDGTFRVLIAINDREVGVNVKLPGVVKADRVTGRLTARFEDNPQVPIKHFKLVFKVGDRAALVNPPACSTATTTGVFTPWSRGGRRSDGVVSPGTPDVTATSVFDVSWDGQGGRCPQTLPFRPTMKAGTTDSQAGSSSPFTFDLSRDDRTDVISGLNVTLPGGLLAAVKNVALCSDADAGAGTCPAASRVGTATAAAGAGGSPFYLSDQPVSLTGPYRGAPYGLAIAVHAAAGPFDLGTVVVRQALNVDPNDAHVTVVSDPIPTIRDGVPLRVRRIHVVVDRPGFISSPTSCEPKTIGARVFSVGGQIANLTAPLEATGCGKLPFAPKLALRLTGAKEAKVGGHPGLEALVTQQPGEAGMKSVTVTLPLSLALDPNNAESDSLCEFADGQMDQCPEKSVIGTVTAVSPLLKTPVNGKVFFVKGVRTGPGGRLIRTLPTLLIELRGEINVNLRATNSVPDNKHLTSAFTMIPDAPISSFSMKLNGGKKGILVITDGHDDVCYRPQKPFFAAMGQNGKRLDTSTTLSIECSLAVVSRTFTKTSVRVKVSGLAAGGTLTLSGAGVKTTRRTVSSGTSATVAAKLTAAGRRMRRSGRDVRVKASFVAKGSKKAKVAYSAKRKVKKKN